METKPSKDKAIQQSPLIEEDAKHEDEATGQTRKEDEVKEVSISDIRKHGGEEWPSVSWP